MPVDKKKKKKKKKKKQCQAIKTLITSSNNNKPRYRSDLSDFPVSQQPLISIPAIPYTNKKKSCHPENNPTVQKYIINKQKGIYF